MADRPMCVGIKANGHRCDKRTSVGEVRCRTHLKTIVNNGPNTTILKEIEYTHRRLLIELRNTWDVLVDAEHDAERRQNLIQDFEHQYQTTRIQQEHERRLIKRQQNDEVRRTGVDPDREANARKEENRRLRIEARHMGDHGIRNHRFEQLDDDAIPNILNRAVAVNQHHDAELHRFATDNQNIHTVRAVNMTKEMVALILRIPVPPDYRWVGDECSKTPGDIIMTCKLTPKAAWQMISKYCQDESIYELEKGIYGKVLDGVWQYILSSPDKSDLCHCLKQEMEDNIGMCAQGNLSRVCNILAGYLDGISSQESISELLGRLFPKLMEIDDLPTRLTEAFAILNTNKVPVSEWKDWVEPLVSDQDEDMNIRFVRNSTDEIIGFVAKI